MATDRNAKVTWTGSLMEGSGTDRGRRQRGVRPAGRDLGVARGGAGRPDEPGGADRGRVGVVLLDGALARARRGRNAARAARDVRHCHVPARRGHRQGRDRGRRDRAGDRPRRVRRAGRGSEGELPGLEGAHRHPRGDARRDPREPPKSSRAGRERAWPHLQSAAVWPPWTTSPRSSSGPTRSSRSGSRTRTSTRTTARRPTSVDASRSSSPRSGGARVAAGVCRPRGREGRPRAVLLGGRARGGRRAARGRAAPRARRARPGRREGRHRRGPAGRRRRRGGALGRGRRPDAAALRGAPRVSHGAPLGRARATGAGSRSRCSR